MDFLIQIDPIRMERAIILEGITGPNYDVFSKNPWFTLNYGADPDEMLHFVAFHLGYDCFLNKTFLRIFSLQRLMLVCWTRIFPVLKTLWIWQSHLIRIYIVYNWTIWKTLVILPSNLQGLFLCIISSWARTYESNAGPHGPLVTNQHHSVQEHWFPLFLCIISSWARTYVSNAGPHGPLVTNQHHSVQEHFYPLFLCIISSWARTYVSNAGPHGPLVTNQHHSVQEHFYPLFLCIISSWARTYVSNPGPHGPFVTNQHHSVQEHFYPLFLCIISSWARTYVSNPGPHGPFVTNQHHSVQEHCYPQLYHY